MIDHSATRAVCPTHVGAYTRGLTEAHQAYSSKLDSRLVTDGWRLNREQIEMTRALNIGILGGLVRGLRLAPSAHL
jgi:hypothetical protein